MERLFDTLAVIGKYKKLYEKRCQGLMKKYDLRIADIDILYYVSHAGTKNLSKDIADEGMSKANVSKSVEHLHQKGYVNLCADKEDRRCVHIELDETAEPIILEIQEIRRGMCTSLAEGITQEDRTVVNRVLHQLNENISQELVSMEEQ